MHMQCLHGNIFSIDNLYAKVMLCIQEESYLTCFKLSKARSTVIIVGPRTRSGRYTT